MNVLILNEHEVEELLTMEECIGVMEDALTALANGGQVGMPLAKTFFSPQFGMLTDRFGVMWMVMVEA